MEIKQNILTRNDCFALNNTRADSRYRNFQDNGPRGLMLHSVGCSQPSASVFCSLWNKAGISKCVHGFIDANTGVVWQTLPWNYRGWHCGGSGNNTTIGVEMCEPDCIQYISGAKFVVTNSSKAKEMATRTYNSAVELFAMLCQKYNLNPLTDIYSHSEGYKKGIASGHSDPEHLWKGLGLPYSVDTFRTAVLNCMNGGAKVPENAVQKATEVYYTVVRGDSLSKIAKLYGTTYKKIAALNGLTTPYIIHPGQKLRVK